MTLTDQLLKVALFGSTWVLYLLLALSIASFTAVIERWYFFLRYGQVGEGLRKKLSSALLADDLVAAQQILHEDRSVVARVLSEALRWRAGGASAVADVVDSELGRVRPELERGLNLLGTLGNNAPFIGLFGTVLGVIQAFHQLGAHGNKAAAMGNVMSGISEALVATGVGIFVALPAVVAYNAAQKRIGQIEASVHSLAKLLTAYITTKERGPNALSQVLPADSSVKDGAAKAATLQNRREEHDVAHAVAAPAGGE